jgi:site-specific recombinase XerD
MTAVRAVSDDGHTETFAELSRSWRRDLRSEGKAALTIASYMRTVRKFAAWLESKGQPATLDSFTKASVQEFLFNMEDSGAKPSSRATWFAVLHKFGSWLVEEEYIRDHPMAKLHQPKADPPVVGVLEPAGLAKLMAACTKPASGGTPGFAERRDEALLRLLADTGCRVSEIANLKLGDLDLDDDVIGVLGKGSKPRTCPFGARTGKALDRYLRLRRSRGDASSPWLFVGQRGRLTPDGINDILHKRAVQAGLGHLHAHQLRHSFAHNQLKAGMAEGDLMRLTGWKSREMLSRYGAVLSAERALSAHRKLSIGDSY